MGITMHAFRCGGLLCLIGHVLLLFHGSVASASVNSTNDIFSPHTWKTWSINDPDVINHTSGLLKPLLRYNVSAYNYSFVCGFFSPRGAKDRRFFFGIVSLYSNTTMNLVWSANRNRPVKENATLQLSEDGGLVLQDVEYPGSVVWSTKNTTKSGVITKMNLTESGNLVLYGRNGRIVWQSFEHPSDTLLHGQTFPVGGKLISNSSEDSPREGLYSLLASHQNDNDTVLQFFYDTQEEYLTDLVINGSYIQDNIPDSLRFLRLDHDGHLRQYSHRSSVGSDLGKLEIPCAYPMTCGKYGICTAEDRCDCPQQYASSSDESQSIRYFKPVDANKPKSGCRAITELFCPSSRQHFLKLEGVSYFYSATALILKRNSKKSCQDACLKNCSCKAAMFFSNNSDLVDYCYLQSEIFSLRKVQSGDSQHPFSPNGSYTTYLKVQDAPHSGSTFSKSKIVGSIIGGFVGIILVIIAIMILLAKKGKFEE